MSSPSTRSYDLVRKRALYERDQVPEFWFVDLDPDVVQVYRLGPNGRYDTPLAFAKGDEIHLRTCPAWPSTSPTCSACGDHPAQPCGPA